MDDLSTIVAQKVQWHFVDSGNLYYWTNRIGSERKAMFRLRNASVDSVMYRLHSIKHHSIYDVSRPITRICEIEDEQIHHGVAIGDIISIRYESLPVSEQAATVRIVKKLVMQELDKLFK